jgi:hypothetical protein
MTTTLQDLVTRWTKHDTTTLPRRALLDDLKLLPEVFQPRFEAHTDGLPNPRDRKAGIVYRDHVVRLATHLKEPGKELDPITVLRVGRSTYLTDGHHRLAAYRSAGRQEIPIVWFTDDPAQAVIAAGAVNFKDVAQSDSATKTQRAWDMVRGDYAWSRSQIMAATTVSQKTVNNMRVAKKKHEGSGESPPVHWRDARVILWPPKEESDPNEDRELPKHVEQTVSEWTNRLKKTFPVLNNSGKAQMLALALARFSPRRAEDIAMVLVDELNLYERVATAYEQAQEEWNRAYEPDTDGPVEGEF